MVTVWLMAGSCAAGAILCGPGPGIWKLMVSVPGVAFDCWMAARSVQWFVPSLQTLSPV